MIAAYLSIVLHLIVCGTGLLTESGTHSLLSQGQSKNSRDLSPPHITPSYTQGLQTLGLYFTWVPEI